MLGGCTETIHKPSEILPGTFHGLGLETDESTPFGNRWTGYRFQVTIMHVPIIRPIVEWEASDDSHPVTVLRVLLDICHAPTKDGRGLVSILEKQLQRLGCTLADVASGSTDGGGENVGKEGMHSHFESLGQGYVRRRGLEHLSWRVCDAGLAEAAPLVEQYNAPCRYLHDGIAWTRLKSIATLPVDAGGLALMSDTSAEYAAVFTTPLQQSSPSAQSLT